MDYPIISIVTPSYNQGQYLEQTIQSVLGQNYPNLEYIIIDGGSDDNSVEIIKKYEKFLKFWISEKDNGQSHAINKGFKHANGDILAWINSDDMYMPGLFNIICKEIRLSEPGIYLGECIHFKENSDFLQCWGSNVSSSSKAIDLFTVDWVIQPSTFWTKEVRNVLGELKEDLHFGFDWEWFMRAKKMGMPFYLLNRVCSLYRFHEFHKSNTGGLKRQQELLQIYNEYNPKIGGLYKVLMTEKVFHNYFFRLLKKVSSLFNSQLLNNEGKRIKLFKYFKYIKYSSSEINFVKKML